MHTHFYQAGGAWKTADGIEYTIKAFNRLEGRAALKDGWFKSLDDALAIEGEVIPEEGSEHEKELRVSIKALGGTPAGRSSIKTLEAQLKELENGDINKG